MRLSIQDKNEILKALVLAEDLPSLKRWLVGMVQAIDDLPEGKADAAVPRYAPPSLPQRVPQSPAGTGYPSWGDGTLAPNGARL